MLVPTDMIGSNPYSSSKSTNIIGTGFIPEYTQCAKTIQEIYRIVLHSVFGGMNPIAVIFVELKFGLGSNHNGRNLHFDLLENARNFSFDMGVLEPFRIILGIFV